MAPEQGEGEGTTMVQGRIAVGAEEVDVLWEGEI
jgi:hypothetical protein